MSDDQRSAIYDVVRGGPKILTGLITLVIITIVTVIGGCESEVQRDEALREMIWSDALSMHIEGGSFTQTRQIQWGEGLRYEVELSLESLHAEIDLIVKGCEPALVSFYARYHPQRYQVISKVYTSSSQEVDANSNLAQRGLIQINNDLFESKSPILDLSDRASTLNDDSGRQEMRWSVLINGGTNPVDFMGEEQISNLLNDEARSEYNQHRDHCVQRRELSAYQLDQDQYLIRHQIRYQWTPPFRLGAMSQPRDRQHLEAFLADGERMGLDGVIILGGLSDGTESGLSKSRQTLSTTPLFWWALPDHNEAGLSSAWLSQIGALNYALDIGSIRLLFLDLSHRVLSETQLALITRWVNPAPLSSLDQIKPHTLTLLSLTPLVKSAQQLEYPLSYRLGSLRILSALREAHLTHHVISGVDSGYGLNSNNIESLGVQLLNSSISGRQILELELSPQCRRTDQGETCITWRESMLSEVEAVE